MKTSRSLLLAASGLVTLVVSGLAMAGEPRTMSPKDGSVPALAKYEAYKKIAERHGVKPRSDRALVIGFRGRDMEGKAHPLRIRPGYRDRLVILTTGRDVVELPLSTHPWQNEGKGVPDVDGDGVADVGMILPGQYLAVRRDARRDIAGAPTYHLLTAKGRGKLPGVRNTDQDDRFSPEELRASLSRGDTLTAVLFHREGGEDDPRPVGCQILDAEGMQALAEAVGERFDYLLIDAREGESPRPLGDS